MPYHNSINNLLPYLDRLSSPCWIWQGAETKNGYGKVQWGGKTTTAHSVFYKHFNGEVPEGYEIDHVCKNKLCVNPKHLEAVTHSVNILRVKGNNCIRGHELNGANLYVTPDNRRQCKACMKIRADRRVSSL